MQGFKQELPLCGGGLNYKLFGMKAERPTIWCEGQKAYHFMLRLGNLVFCEEAN